MFRRCVSAVTLNPVSRRFFSSSSRAIGTLGYVRCRDRFYSLVPRTIPNVGGRPKVVLDCCSSRRSVWAIVDFDAVQTY